MLKFFTSGFGLQSGHEIVGPHRSPDRVGQANNRQFRQRYFVPQLVMKMSEFKMPP
jgi:hypothetical protein